MIDGNKFQTEGREISKKFIKKLSVVLSVMVMLILIGYSVSVFYDYFQMNEIGSQYNSIFLTNIIAKIITQGISFVFSLIVVLIALFFVRKNLQIINVEQRVLKKKTITVLISIVLAMVLSSIISKSLYLNWLSFINPQWFGKNDPIFGKDIGYYVFQRPFLMSVAESFMSIWVFITFMTAVLYIILGGVFGGNKIKNIFSEKSVLTHNIVNIAVLLLINIVTYKFKSESLLYDSFGGLEGAGYTAKAIWLNYYRIVPVLLIVLVITALVYFKKAMYKKTIKTLLIYPLFWIVAGVAALIIQSVIVSPNEVIRENENIQNNINYTQSAYNLDKISQQVFDVKNNFNINDIKENEDTISNIRILDVPSNLTVLNQIQGIRNYYRFNETDIVPYDINGKKTAVAITPREVTKENLSDSSDTYINKKLRYTHGFGIAMNVINSVTNEGQPEFLVKDIPPKSAQGVVKITQPRIYYGELTDDYVIVNNDKYKELDYSEGQEDIEFSYNGKSGIKLNWINRIMIAARYGDFRLLISDLINSDSKVLINRNIVDRLKIVAPFFKYDNDPYMVADKDGRLKWIVDVYTTTPYYPYSQNYDGYNYIRNSVKAVIDAYDGDVSFYIVDDKDPIAAAYRKIYPNLFSKDTLPDCILAHSKYPEYLFNVQAAVYSKYHISNPTTFYNKNDLWVIAKEKYGTTADEKDIEAYYNMMKLENNKEGELLLSIPYTLSNKDNMVAWLAVRNDWNNYGKLQVYKFPKDINVYGPMQIENRINSDMDISKELSLWSQGGSKVIRGNMIVVPIRNSILYVEPLYITSSNESTLPELKQVIVAYNEKIIMRDNLNDAIYALFDAKAPAEGDKDIIIDMTADEIISKVIQSFNKVKSASANNSWEEFGQSMNDLEQSIGELENSRNPQPDKKDSLKAEEYDKNEKNNLTKDKK